MREQLTRVITRKGVIIYKLANGKPHRDDGPAVIYPNGEKSWYQYGMLYREDGPARTCRNGRKFWYRDNKLHREDGPAVVRPTGKIEFWLGGKFIPEDSMAGQAMLRKYTNTNTNNKDKK